MSCTGIETTTVSAIVSAVTAAPMRHQICNGKLASNTHTRSLEYFLHKMRSKKLLHIQLLKKMNIKTEFSNLKRISGRNENRF